MSAPRDYARLHHSWYLDPVLVACAAQVPTALHLWPVLLAMAKASSHAIDNPTGIVSTSSAQLSMIVHATPETVDAALCVLAEGDMVEVSKGRLGTLCVALAGFTKWQTPRGSSAATSQAYRDKRTTTSREKASERDNGVTHASGKSDGEGEERESKAAASSSTARGAAPAVDPAPPKARSVAGQIQSARRELQSHASMVIEGMIGRRQAQTDRMLSDQALLDDYWKPALRLLNEHGSLRMRAALDQAGKNGALHISYLEPILRDAAEQAEAASRPRRKLADVIKANDQFWETAS